GRDDRAGAHVAADADAPEARAPVERRADQRIGDPRLGRRDARELTIQRRLGLLELRRGDDLARAELAAALILTACVGERGLGLGKLRARLVTIELDEDLAAPDLGAFGEADRGDHVRDLRRDLDGLVRARRADGLDLDAERLDDRFRGDDGAAAAAGYRGRTGLCLRFRAGSDKECGHDGETGPPSAPSATNADRDRRTSAVPTRGAAPPGQRSSEGILIAQHRDATL